MMTLFYLHRNLVYSVVFEKLRVIVVLAQAHSNWPNSEAPHSVKGRSSWLFYLEKRNWLVFAIASFPRTSRLWHLGVHERQPRSTDMSSVTDGIYPTESSCS